MKKIILTTLTLSLMTIFSFSCSKTDGDTKPVAKRNSKKATLTKSALTKVTDPKELAELDNSTGIAYMNGTGGFTRNYAKAVEYFRKAAEIGYAPAQFNLGVCYGNGNGVTKDEVEASMWYKKSAEKGNAEAQYMIGIYYMSGIGVSKQYSTGVMWLRKSAENGNVDAQRMLGLFYYLGQGVPENTAESVKWLRKAAAQGDADARKQLRDMGF